MMLKNITDTQDQHGLSLIEFMIAMLLGTILIGGAVSIYLASSRSYTEAERSISLGNSARFALQVMTDSIRHAGFIAGLEGQDVVPHANLDEPGGNCADAAGPECDANDLSRFLFAMRFNEGDADPFGIIDDAKGNSTDGDTTDGGSDILVVKYLLPEPLMDADPNDPSDTPDGVISFPRPMASNVTYVVANAERGLLMDGEEASSSFPDVADGEPMARGQAWAYQFQIYYVRDPGGSEPPVLARKTLRWDTSLGSMAVVTEDLVQGVENMRFRFGFDTDADGDMDTYRDLREPQTPAPANWDWTSVGFIEVFLLVRSLDDDPNYADEKTYAMADLEYTPATDDPNSPSDAHPQEFSRLMVSSPITLRNRLFYIRGGQ